jgi:hypothetical protein
MSNVKRIKLLDETNLTVDCGKFHFEPYPQSHLKTPQPEETNAEISLKTGAARQRVNLFFDASVSNQAAEFATFYTS